MTTQTQKRTYGVRIKRYDEKGRQREFGHHGDDQGNQQAFLYYGPLAKTNGHAKLVVYTPGHRNHPMKSLPVELVGCRQWCRSESIGQGRRLLIAGAVVAGEAGGDQASGGRPPRRARRRRAPGRAADEADQRVEVGRFEDLLGVALDVGLGEDGARAFALAARGVGLVLGFAHRGRRRSSGRC